METREREGLPDPVNGSPTDLHDRPNSADSPDSPDATSAADQSGLCDQSDPSDPSDVSDAGAAVGFNAGPRGFHWIFDTTNWIVVAAVFLGAVACGVVFDRAVRLSARNICQENLVKIDGAKSTWSLENCKAATDVPRWEDLIWPGDRGYLRAKPLCPSHGDYSLLSIDCFPECSVRGGGFDHTYPVGVSAATPGMGIPPPPLVDWRWIFFGVLFGLAIAARYQALPSLFLLFGAPRWLKDSGLRDDLAVVPSPHLTLLRYMDRVDQRFHRQFFRAVFPPVLCAVLFAVLYRAAYPLLQGAWVWWLLGLILLDVVAVLDLAGRKLRGGFDVYRLILHNLYMRSRSPGPGSRSAGGMRSAIPWLLTFFGAAVFPVAIVVGLMRLFAAYPAWVMGWLTDPPPSYNPAVQILFVATLVPLAAWFIPASLWRQRFASWRDALGRGIDRRILDAAAGRPR